MRPEPNCFDRETLRAVWYLDLVSLDVLVVDAYRHHRQIREIRPNNSIPIAPIFDHCEFPKLV